MITDEQKLKLIEAFEVQFIGILLQHGVVEYINPPESFRVKKEVSHTFKNVLLNDKNYRKVTILSSSNSDSGLVVDLDALKEWVIAYRKLFPVKRKGTVKVVLKKIIRFLNEEGKGYTLEDVWRVTEEYIQVTLIESGAMMVRSADNIIYKKVKGGEEMKLLELLEAEAETHIDAFDKESGISSSISGADDLDNYSDDLDLD